MVKKSKQPYRFLHSGSAGFTLIEAIVSASLFAVVMVTLTGVYTYTLKLNRKSDALRTASDTARFISDSLSKEIRNGQIDYSPESAVCSNTPPYNIPDARIAILDVSGNHECYYLGDLTQGFDTLGTNLWLAKNQLTPVPLNLGDVTITSFKVYVSPYNADPYTTPGVTVQPTITIVGSVTATIDANDIATVPFDTSITIPKYDF